jgi:hypothetical protein
MHDRPTNAVGASEPSVPQHVVSGSVWPITCCCSWEPGSYGYHGDDGHKFHSAGVGEEYGPKWTTGDTVGAGLDLGRQEIFFT